MNLTREEALFPLALEKTAGGNVRLPVRLSVEAALPFAGVEAGQPAVPQSKPVFTRKVGLDRYSGREINCPGCKQQIRVPGEQRPR